MEIVHVSYDVRPTRIAFAVPKPDPTSVKKVIQLNSTLWGGIYNPIIILDGATRVQVGKQQELEGRSYEEELLGTLKEFDPDYIVNYSSAELPRSLQAFEDRTLGPDQLRWNQFGHKEVGYFLEVWPFLRALWKEEFKGASATESRIQIVEYPDDTPEAPFLAAQFGVYPESHDIAGKLCEHFGATRAQYDSAFREAFVFGENVYPIDLTNLELTVPRRAIDDGFVFFILDPTNLFDVVDFWNLRATGALVFPLPVSDYRDLVKSVRGFAERAHYPINPHVMASAVVIKARSIGDDQHDEIGRWMSEIGVKEFTLKGWYPRFGVRHDRVVPEVRASAATASHSNIIAVLAHGFGTLQGTLPPCEFRDDERFQQWSAELQFYTDMDESNMFRVPWLNRGCDKMVGDYIGGSFGINASRGSRRGLVIHQLGDDRDVSIRPIPVREVVRAVLNEAGFQFQGSSTAGLAVERIVSHLGHLSACRVFRHPGLRQVLHELEGGHSTLPAKDIAAILERKRRPAKYDQQTTGDLLNLLTAKKVLRPGLVFKCASCGHRDWYHISKFDESFTCQWCFVEQQCPRLDSLPWHYRSDGLFKLGGGIQGSLTVLLALTFLEQYLKTGMKYYPSFNYLDDRTQHEVDFIAFSTEYFKEDVHTIIGEAKMGAPLKTDEFTKLKEIGERTNAYLAFCTLAPSFSNSNIEHFESLIRDGRKLILLTASHLDMHYKDVLELRRKHRAPYHAVETLSRASTIEILGQDVASKHRIWL